MAETPPKSGMDGTPYGQMTPHQKLIFICKLVVSIASFGIIFPNVMSD